MVVLLRSLPLNFSHIQCLLELSGRKARTVDDEALAIELALEQSDHSSTATTSESEEDHVHSPDQEQEDEQEEPPPSTKRLKTEAQQRGERTGKAWANLEF